jgi:DHA1 family inner membrane transport protein
LALLGAGACGTIGVFFGGHLVNRHPVVPLAAIFPLLSLIYLIASFAVPGRVWIGIVFNCMLWLVATVWIAPAQARVVVGAGTAPELASTLIASVFSVGIALGAWFGGICLARGAELSSLPLIGFASSVVATLLAALAIALDRREGRLARQSVAL